MRKVFIIGYNKTATTALDHLFKKSGYKTVHNDFGKLAIEIYNCVKEGKDPLGTYQKYDVFSDLIHSTPEWYLEANKYYKEIHSAYPNAYFIYNTRRTDKWITSRFNHQWKGRRFFIEAMQALRQETENDLERYWRTMKSDFERDVQYYFKDNENFLYFDTENEPIETLIEFVKEDYTLNKDHWQRLNVTKG